MSAELHRIYIEEGTVWVTEANDQLIGFITAREDFDEDILHILELAVADGHQGQGIGRRLMDAVKGYAAKNEIKSITLTTFRDLAFNEHFYHRLGYKTLSDGELTPRLADTLDAEVNEGLPRKRRCAMAMVL